MYLVFGGGGGHIPSEEGLLGASGTAAGQKSSFIIKDQTRYLIVSAPSLLKQGKQLKQEQISP